MQIKNLTSYRLSKETGISDSLIGYYRNGHKDPSSKNLIKIADYLDVSVDYLLGRTDDPAITVNQNPVGGSDLTDAREQIHIRKYRAVDAHGRRTIDTVTEYEYERCYPAGGNIDVLYEEYTEFPIQSEWAAAGLGNYLTDQGFDLVPVRASDIPKKAKYGVRIDGDSMEPDYQTGDIIFIEPMPAIQSGELGLFTLDGDCLFKQLIVDHDRKLVILRSLNPEYEDRIIERGQDLHTYGRVVGFSREQ